MKFKIVFIAAILISNFSYSQSKVGTVDSGFIISLMPEREIVIQRANQYGAKLDTSFNVKMKEYNLKVEAFKKLDKSELDSIKKKKYTEILLMDQEIQKYKQNGAQLMQLKKSELMRPLYNKLSVTIQEVAKENGYTQILTISGNDFVYIDKKLDITLLVMKKLGIKEPVADKK